MIINGVKNIIPKRLRQYYKERQKQKKIEFVESLPVLSIEDFKEILKKELNVKKGDILFIHSSIDYLNAEFSELQVLSILLDVVGEKGTLIFPTYPKLTSYKFLKQGQIFNVRKTPSYMGLLSEFARRHSQTIRSFHPTKSVAAIGRYAKEITSEHHKSPYPYDITSPYYKMTEYNAKVIGLGVDTTFLSCVHCADDYLKDDFPVNPYHKTLFKAKCINYEKETIEVPTYAHNMIKMNFDIPKFVKTKIPNDICRDIKMNGMRFFYADSKKLINLLVELARNNVTIYKKIFHKL